MGTHIKLDMLLQHWGAWRLYTKSADEGFSLLCRARHCRCTPWPCRAVWQEHTALEAHKAGTHNVWSSSAGRDGPFLETATASPQMPGTGGSERSCSAIFTAPVPCTATVKASVEVWEDSSIALWNPHLQQHDSFSLNSERTWLLFQTLWKCGEILSDCQHPFMLSLWSWHLANRSKSKKPSWFCPPAEPACLNWNSTSRLSEVVSGVHKQNHASVSAQATCNPSGTPSGTLKDWW